MPASTSDPISSMLQRTFGGLDHKREGLIRGGNSSSATPRPFSVDKKLQASAKHGLIANNMEGSSINFDSPTSYKSDTSGLGPKVIVLNPNQSSQKSNVVAKKEQKDDKPGEGLPKAKVNALNLITSYQNIPNFVFQDSLKLVILLVLTLKLYWM